MKQKITYKEFKMLKLLNKKTAVKDVEIYKLYKDILVGVGVLGSLVKKNLVSYSEDTNGIKQYWLTTKGLEIVDKLKRNKML